MTPRRSRGLPSVGPGLLIAEPGFEPRSLGSHVCLFPHTPGPTLPARPLSAKEKTFAMF